MAFVLLMIFVLIAFYTDVTKQKIPNVLNVCGVLVGLVYHGFRDGGSGLLFSLLGATVGFLALLLLYVLKALEAGDVKLFAAIGALTGVEFTLYSLLYAIVYAGVIGVGLILLRREFVRRIANILRTLVLTVLHKGRENLQEFARDRNHLRFPFMYAVLPAVITTFYYYSY